MQGIHFLEGESWTRSHCLAFTESQKSPLTATNHTRLSAGCKIEGPLKSDGNRCSEDGDLSSLISEYTCLFISLLFIAELHIAAYSTSMGISSGDIQSKLKGLEVRALRGREGEQASRVKEHLGVQGEAAFAFGCG